MNSAAKAVSVTNPEVVAVVMAGGQGTRFWPMSRSSRPKQFLSMSDSGESLIQSTVRRIAPLVGDSNVWVVSNPSLGALIAEHVPGAKLVSEPVPRNTAACIGLAAIQALVHYPSRDPVLVVLPADHAVRDEERLRSALSEAITAAIDDDALVTIGIPPTHPHTGYGYIKRGPHISGRVHRVERFFEKPNVERARKYLEDGSYSWNSGMFVWRAEVILDAFREFLPEMYQGLIEIKGILEAGATARGQERIGQIFTAFDSISIDFGILEHTRNCLVVNADEFGWNDVGSWDQWAENFATDSNRNLVKGDAVVIDSEQCVVKSDGRLLALVGMKDVVVIDTGDAVLVCARDSVQDVKKVVDELKRRGRSDLV